MSYQAGRLCDECGDPSPYVPICGRCEDLAKCETTAHAAGYAEGRAAERAAVVEWMRGGDDVFPELLAVKMADQIEQGAHVGAAKKGGGT